MATSPLQRLHGLISFSVYSVLALALHLTWLLWLEASGKTSVHAEPTHLPGALILALGDGAAGAVHLMIDELRYIAVSLALNLLFFLSLRWLCGLLLSDIFFGWTVTLVTLLPAAALVGPAVNWILGKGFSWPAVLVIVTFLVSRWLLNNPTLKVFEEQEPPD